MNKKKIFNDPIYGFIDVPNEFIFRLIEHPYFQRLRRIRQLGLTHLVYPGALHTRFHHAMGSMYLMGQAFFSAQLIHRFNPRSVVSVALCSQDDSVLRPLIEQYPNMKVIICPRSEVA